MRTGLKTPSSGRLTRYVRLLLAAGLLATALGCGAEERDANPRPSGARVTNTEAAFAFDPADKRKLVAFADNVFVGRVAKQRGKASARTSAPDVRLAQTQFTVVVVKNIKGRLKGPVTVNQYGGTVDVAPKRGRVRSPDPEVELWDSDPILKPGEVALFGTRRDADHGWHTIVAQPFADRRIRSRAEGDRVVREFKQAHETSRAP